MKYIVVIGILIGLSWAHFSMPFGISVEPRDSVPFSMDGTKLESLENALVALRESEEREYSIAGAPLIRSSQYPLQFLHSLIPLQHARETFLNDPSRETERAYTRALARTSKLHVRATARALHQAHNTPDIKRQNYSGTITGESERAALQSLHQSAIGISRGAFLTASSTHLKNVKKPREEVVEKSVYIQNIFADVTREELRDEPIVFLEESACFEEKGPHPFVMDVAGEGRHPLPVRSLSALFFTDAAMRLQAGDTWVSYYIEHDVPLIALGPNSFYQCPDFGRDVARVSMLRSAAEFLGVESLVTESDILQQLTASSNEKASRYLSMYKNSSAGFEYVVQSIADVNDALVDLVDVGAVEKHALSQRASIYDATFPLLLGHMQSVNLEKANFYASRDASAFRKFIVAWQPEMQHPSEADARRYTEYVFDLHQE